MKLLRRDIFTGTFGMFFGGGLITSFRRPSEQVIESARLPSIPTVVIERSDGPTGSLPLDKAHGYAEEFSNTGQGKIRIFISVPELHNGIELREIRVIDALTDQVVYTQTTPSMQIEAQVCYSFRGTGCAYTNTIDIPGNQLPNDSFLKAICVFSNDLDCDPIYFCMEPLESLASDMIVVLPSITWQAYAQHGGHSFYTGREPAEVSLHRPFRTTGPNTPQAAEAYLRSLRSLDIPFSIMGDMRLHEGSDILNSAKIWNLPIHAEYWSSAMRENFENYLRANGSVWIVGGNTMWLKVRIEGRNIKCHKTNWHIDPIDQAELKTGRFGKNAVNDPEIRTIGMSYEYGGFPIQRTYKSIEEMPNEIRVTQDEYDASSGLVVQDPDHPIFDTTGLRLGDRFGVESKVLAYEFDGVPLTAENRPDRERAPEIPPNIQLLANGLKAYFGKRETVCNVVEFQFEGRGTVLNFGSHGWAFAVDSDEIIKKIYKNTFSYLVS